MSDNVPTTEQVRNDYQHARWCGDPRLRHSQTARLEFDRWLAAHDAEVAARAWGEGKSAGVEHERLYEKYRTGELTEIAYVRQSERLTPNPYRKAVQ